jgi:digeranylgeranylglycerophospholipid reductase
MFDVVVIGGNLSGATAAINSAKSGASTVLVEKNKEPYFPSRCGEATDKVTASILNLDEIGCPKNEIKQITINVSSIKEYNFKLKKRSIVIIDRNFLEKYLLKKAENYGAELKLGQRMVTINPPNDIVLDNNEIIKGKVIIDATGISCQIGRRIGINTKLRPKNIGVCIQSRVQSIFDSEIMKIWFHKPYAPFGYAWIFPKNEKIANIGIGVAGGQKLDLIKLKNMYIDDKIGKEFKITHTFRSCVPSSKPLEPLTKDNIMFVGDAARLANPVIENGIGNAIFSGSLAGKIAGKYIQRKIHSLKNYEKLMNKKVSRLTRNYNWKNKIKTDSKFAKSYRRIISLLCTLNKIFPNICENQLLGIVKKDKKILDSFK